MESLSGSVAGLLEIIFANAILSGDNAVVIGLAAAGLPAHQRGRAVLFGVVAAAVLRIVFSIFATFLLSLWWIELVGGVALLYIAWSFWRELRGKDHGEVGEGHAPREKSLMSALWQIIVADVSMSLDNVLAIAAIARNNFTLLIVGLLVSIVMMGLLGGVLARVLERYRWIAYVGLALIVYIAAGLLWEGAIAANANLALGLPLPLPHDAAATPGAAR